MNIVVVLSGGLDSTTLLFHLRSQGNKVKALGVNYGQRHVRELDRARIIAGKCGVEFKVADLTALKPLLAGSALTSDDIEVPEGHYADESMKATVVPNRNMLILSVATAWAVSLKYDAVAYAAHAGDHAIYPDCRPEFADALGKAIERCDWQKIKLLRPFVRMTKADIAKRADELGVPIDMTWSCYKGGNRHCGKCGTCTERREAFALAGVKDPTVYE